jgi:hypothetical protein
MVKVSAAEVLRLRAPSAVSRDKSVKRSAQDDDFVGIWTKNILNELALGRRAMGTLSKDISKRGRRNCRSLHFAPPDFLWELVALSHFMRLSLTERRIRGLVQRSVAGNPGRDDKGEGGASIQIRFCG